MDIATHYGDCRAILPTIEAESVQAIVTSPPYWRLRRYTDSPDEIGQEATPAEYVEALRAVFAECRRVLRQDGTLWLNLADAYADDRKWGGMTGGKHAKGLHGREGPGRRKVKTGLPPKSLIGLPWRVAFALQDDGWILRSEIIWEKPNAMPESVTDRPTRSHETLFLFSKAPRYYYGADAIREPMTRERNTRTVWTISTTPCPEAHYAPMPLALAERCILAGSRPGDIVLDPFAGTGTTGRVAIALQRRAVLIDLAYADIQERRLNGVQTSMELPLCRL